MKRLAFLTTLVLVALACPAYGHELEASFGADVVRITDAPCTDGVVSGMEDSESYAAMRAAWAMVGGKRFEGCWRMRPDGAVYLRYDDGDQGLVPRQKFESVKAA